MIDHDHTRTYTGNDSNRDILSSWTEADFAGLDADQAQTLAAYCDARRVVWDRKLTCPDTVADSDWEEACGCQDLYSMPWATELLRAATDAE